MCYFIIYVIVERILNIFSSVKGPLEDFTQFGQSLSDDALTSTVKMLYTNATVESTRSTSKMGQQYFCEVTKQWFGFLLYLAYIRDFP